MISNHLSMVEALRPKSNELAHDIEAFLSSGGAIKVLEGPTFEPPPPRHEPPPRAKTVKPHKKAEAPKQHWLDKMAQRDLEREERAAKREQEKADLLERVRKLAETMTHAQAEQQTGMARRTLQRFAIEGGFKFRPALKTRRPQRISEEEDLKYAERIRAFKEVGLSRYQAMVQIGVTFKTFNRLLLKFDIDYPKARKGPEPACFSKKNQE